MGAAHILYPQDSYQGVERTTGAKLFTGMFNNKMLLGGYEVIYDTIGSQETIMTHCAGRARGEQSCWLV